MSPRTSKLLAAKCKFIPTPRPHLPQRKPVVEEPGHPRGAVARFTKCLGDSEAHGPSQDGVTDEAGACEQQELKGRARRRAGRPGSVRSSQGPEPGPRKEAAKTHPSPSATVHSCGGARDGVGRSPDGPTGDRTGDGGTQLCPHRPLQQKTPTLAGGSGCGMVPQGQGASVLGQRPHTRAGHGVCLI